MIVFVKMFSGYKVINKLGVLDIDWYFKYFWCLSVGVDGICRFWV